MGRGRRGIILQGNKIKKAYIPLFRKGGNRLTCGWNNETPVREITVPIPEEVNKNMLEIAKILPPEELVRKLIKPI